MKVCAIEGCEKKTVARGWCGMHWQRWRRNGEPGEAELRHSQLPDQCTIGECSRPPVGRGLCGMHYYRWQKHGDPGAAEPLVIQDHPEICTVPGCDRPYRSRGMCSTHHARLRVTGDPRPARPIGHAVGEEVWSYRGEDAGYVTVHLRLRQTDGPAKYKHCHHCGGSASDWAYDHGDPNERLSANGHPYSTNPERYMPLCRSCHTNFDNQWKKLQGATP
jgi:hypothetical protein